MTSAIHDPTRVLAVVVGVERYRLPETWSLNGPAADALRFVHWFLDAGVPPERVLALISPLSGAAKEDWPVAVRPAESHIVRRALLEEVGRHRGDMLWVVWGGHGVVDSRHGRRLFFADANDADPVNLSLDAMLHTYGSDHIAGFDSQLWIVDSCQTLTDQLEMSERSLGAVTYPRGRSRREREQHMLVAASRGEAATNLGAERAGLFSREMLRLLGRPGPATVCAPPVSEIADGLVRTFKELRDRGVTQQTPFYFHSLGGSNEWEVRWPASDRDRDDADGGDRDQPDRARLKDPGPRRDAAIMSVVLALSATGHLADARRRRSVVERVAPDLAEHLRPRANAPADLVGLVRACFRHPDRPHQLVEQVRAGATDPVLLEEFEAAVGGMYESMGGTL